MAWPAGGVPTTNVDAGSDVPALARLDIKTLIDQFNQAIASRGDVDGVCELDANLRIPAVRMGYATGTYSVTLGGNFADDRHIAHGLGTDDLDCGVAVYAVGASIIEIGQYSAHVMTANRFVVANVGNGGAGLGVASFPAAGSLALRVVNTYGASRTLQVNWWARVR